MFFKILSVILGVMMIAGGINCTAMPLETYSVLPVLMGIALLADGVGRVVAWADARRRDESRALLLISAILSVLMGVFLLCNDLMQLSVDLVLPYFVSGWMTATGVLRIVESFQIRRLRREAKMIRGRDSAAVNTRGMLREISRKWWIHLILGILLILSGILSFMNPIATMIAMGTCLGIDIIVDGVDLIVLAFAI